MACSSFCVFPTPTFPLANGFLVQLLQLKNDVKPLCHCHSSFEVLALCSDFLKLFGFWFPTFLDEHWYSLSFSVHRSFLQSRFFRANHPMSYFLFCTPSHFRDEFSSSHTSFVHLPQHRLGLVPATTPAFNSSHLVAAQSLPMDHPGLLQLHLLHVLRADHPHVHRHLRFKQQSVPLRERYV